MAKAKTTWQRAIAMSDKYMKLLDRRGPLVKEEVRFYLQDAWYSGYKQGKKDLRKELKNAKV